jgi:hypothetical protein
MSHRMNHMNWTKMGYRISGNAYGPLFAVAPVKMHG